MPGVRHNMPDGPAQYAYKEEPIQEEPIKEEREAIASTHTNSKSSSKSKESKTALREEVHLTQSEYDKLLLQHGQTLLDRMLDKLNSYKLTHGKTYKSDYHTMIENGWVYKEFKEPKTNPSRANFANKPNSLRTAHDLKVNVDDFDKNKANKDYLDKIRNSKKGV